MNHIKNSVRLIGNLGMAPELRKLSNNNKMVRFSLAVNGLSKKVNPAQEPQWHSIVAWGRQADIAEKMLSKGMQVAIDGQLLVRSYTDKDGIRRTVTEIQADSILLISSGKKN